MNDAIKMQISAFVDGELPQNEAELLLRRLCQDAELRQQTAEYMAMGRIMRGERTVPKMATLRERIFAELDERDIEHGPVDESPAPPRYVRPLAGAAIAATVAVVALVGLQRVDVSPGTETPVGNNTFIGAVEASYTVPEGSEEVLLDYHLRHNASSSFIGINSINPSLVTWELRDGVVVEQEDADDAEASAAVDDEPAAAEQVAQP